MNDLLLENLFGEKALCAQVTRDQLLEIIAAGARSKFPKSLLSMYRVTPRVMTRYPLKLITNESITGVVITTVYNLKKNLNIPQNNKLTTQDIERYYLDKSVEVINLMVGNTSLGDLACGRPRRTKSSKKKDPVIFLGISAPLILVMNSKKSINTYIQDKKSDPSSDYVNINPGIGVLENYGNTYLLDIHNPSSVLTISTIYGLDNNMELKKLSTASEIDAYQDVNIGKSVDLKKFNEIFNTMKKHLSLSNFSI
ncbi:DNA-binding virion core protein [Fowlpox virus]|uniref:Core protein VP8 n=2 Tax=Fowlpox virus TaxID=10261 RepID=VP8_FOWPN|nr:DNA-binding virion core protein [Fowlpox virus]P15913.1 RecName: Full=Core protein VP8; AltName: Full=25 kDa major core protein; AltName: Full=L4 core protein; AltName: Full=P25K; Flags: Precursor [Fowlpox virus strain NVSL]UNS14347.1 ALPV-183 [Albatrosspox virus]WPD90838.1 DNA-binding virion core protein VP8 [Avipoxvirus sp.]CAE52670.1 L4R DNA-binding virion core protein VP8 orthologue [Fowlpox virus isolate HP-438/Munich]AAF44475.1 ORF FPV131 DNA-binding virion core protien VP8 [Fowlpox v